MNPTIICYSKCGTCRKAESWLKSRGVNYNYRPIKEENPTSEELRDWVNKSGLPVTKFFNTSGLLYKELNVKDKVKTLSKDDLLELLASDGMLVKRPILLLNGVVKVGFKEEEWSELF